MKIIELFSGTASFVRVCRFYGEYETLTIDNDSSFSPDICRDILTLTKESLPESFQKPDIIWASPPCTTFSQAGVWHHWDYFEPKTEDAKISQLLVEKTISLIKELSPKYWFIENPRSLLRKFPMMEKLPRKEVCYCRYGDFRMKPTDIWTNLGSWIPQPFCHNGYPDHNPAPRGSVTGTQGMKKREAGRVPQLLCQEILQEIFKLEHLTKPIPFDTESCARCLIEPPPLEIKLLDTEKFRL